MTTPPAGEARSHEPVMVDRIVALLGTPAAGVLVDATLGLGGHAAALLAASPRLHLLGFDRDPEALAIADRRLSAYRDRVTLVHAAYDLLAEHVPQVAAGRPVLGILYDLGVSSLQLDRGERGFSFRADAPLDMRMDPTVHDAAHPTAADLVNSTPPAELVRILRAYGEERSARRIVDAIVRARPLRTTGELAEVVTAALPAAARRRPTHPATKTFQALRIAVNAELDRLSASLPQALGLVAPPQSGGVPGGRIAVLAYHSLEDRLVKRSFSDAATGCICPPDLPVCGCGRVPLVRPLTRGAETPDPDEVERNPRARSAKLRAVQRVQTPES